MKRRFYSGGTPSWRFFIRGFPPNKNAAEKKNDKTAPPLQVNATDRNSNRCSMSLKPKT